MRRRPIRPLPALAAALAALVLTTAPSPAAAADRGREPAPRLLSGQGEARIELPSGERVAFPLPAGAELTAVSGAGEAWFAAGTRPARNGAPNGRAPDGGRQEILLVTERNGRAVLLAAPPASRARLRQEPLPLAEGDRLAGLAWLEGDDPGQLAVRFAAWDGERWESAETVAGRGPGSQLALASAQLADGSWLLAWSAFDGEDDEILWARRSPAGTWSKPRRVAADNRVPDVTPTLAASGDGALLAWSRYDGEGYRVVASRLGNLGKDRWSPPRAVAPSGSVFPELSPAAGGGARLLYRAAWPAGWGLAELDSDGGARRRATVAEATRERPRAVAGSDGVRFLWDGVPERFAPWQAAPPAVESPR